ncbi:CMP-N-acetylneuraminate-beta-galactosamide-alpha-2,3-sialyltransferase 1-like [Onychostoma macrolepis]|uniref:CMP-N-acetylneuraminate-beta-galactosamide- alpha-2,3-sialyltransferase 1-like n=1 Tax=Onychostoma macrolepis TaxID=369639 RepID=UPI00272BC2C4|nr:CMP-N-acetylneuraminate-beta-galactosamide-alpha-2,3-sialyltransferase 1-like [Onychostoma macrolepis]
MKDQNVSIKDRHRERGNKDQQTYVQVPSTIKANKDKVMILHPEFIRYVYDNWAEGHGRYPSTGFLTLIFALHICDEVNVFGFGATSDGNWHHYFDKTLTSYEIGIHGGKFENETINQLIGSWIIEEGVSGFTGIQRNQNRAPG